PPRARLRGAGRTRPAARLRAAQPGLRRPLAQLLLDAPVRPGPERLRGRPGQPVLPRPAPGLPAEPPAPDPQPALARAHREPVRRPRPHAARHVRPRRLHRGGGPRPRRRGHPRVQPADGRGDRRHHPEPLSLGGPLRNAWAPDVAATREAVAAPCSSGSPATSLPPSLSAEPRGAAQEAAGPCRGGRAGGRSGPMLVGVPGDLPPPGPRPLLMTSLPAYPRLLLLGLLALLASGCANYLAPFETQRARPAPPTPTADALSALPPPREPIVAAVYRFRDQTGQYKALENVSTFSTQVTQGATSILMRALEESRWFVPIEREGLSNLLNERQIIQSIRAQHAGPEGEPLGPLPPLLYAGVLLEGGIIGYDSNVLTGGVGVRYLGTGGAGEYRQDQVTVYLRAVSTQSGRVLKSVHTTKTIVSQRVQGNLFRFVDLQ